MGIHLKIAGICVTSRRTAYSNAQPITSTRRNLGLPRGAIGFVLAACAAFLISCGGVAGSFQEPLGASGQLTLNRTSLVFGDVAVGSSDTQTVTLTNSGTASVAVSQANVTGTGFSLSGLPLPLTLATGQATTFSVAFAPASSGSASGSLSLISDAANSPTTLALAANGVLPPSGQLTLNPTSLDFGNVTVGSSDTQTVTLTNSGTASVTISQADLTGPGFSVSSILLTLAAG